ncbi:MAG: hypothetical protein ACFE0O_12645 [Opitutales bacterium]
MNPFRFSSVNPASSILGLLFSATCALASEGLQTRLLERLNELTRFQEFAELYPDARYVITNTSTDEALQAEGRTLFFERYSLNVGVDFKVDPDSGDLVQQGPVDVMLREFRRVRKQGRLLEVDFENEWILDREAWEKVRAAQGDIRVLKKPLVTDRPVPFIQRYWEGM